MVKVYCICVDAFPEVFDLQKHFQDRGFKRHNLVCSGAFTCATMTSIISGSLGSEIISGGIGYNTSYLPRFSTWRKSGQCIMDRILKTDRKVIINNHIPWMSSVILGKPLNEKEKTQHYRDHIANDSDLQVYDFGVIKSVGNVELSSTNPEKTLNTFLEWNFSEKKEKFYSNEKKYISHIQEQKWDGLFWTDLCHWHESVYYHKGQIANGQAIEKSEAIVNSLNWLTFWDTSEDNAVFIFYADHSHTVEPYLDLPGFLTWCYIKDTRSPLRDELTVPRTIASCDFYHLFEEYFQLEYLDVSKWSMLPKDENRIYACEDGRFAQVIKDRATTFLRLLQRDVPGEQLSSKEESCWYSLAKVTDDTLTPKGWYFTIASVKCKYTYTTYILDDNFEVVSVKSIKSSGPLDSKVSTSEKLFEFDLKICKELRFD